MGQPRITAPLVIATLGALIVIIVLSAVGWTVIGNLNDQAGKGDHVEVLAAALAVSRHSSSLAATGAVQSNAGMTRASVIQSRSSIASLKTELTNSLALLEGKGYDDRVSRINEHASLLVSNVDLIENGRPDLLRAMLAGVQNHQKLSMSTTRELVPAISGSLDDQYYFMISGKSDLRDRIAAGSEAFSQEEFIRYTHLSTLLNSVAVAHSSLAVVSRMVNPNLVANLEEAFDTATQRMERSVEYLAENGGPELDPRVVPLSERLIETGAGQGNYFDALRTRLVMFARERELIAANERILDGLQTEIDALVQDVERDYTASKATAAQAASTGRMIMLIIGIVGVIGILLAAGYFAFRTAQPGPGNSETTD